MAVTGSRAASAIAPARKAVGMLNRTLMPYISLELVQGVKGGNKTYQCGGVTVYHRPDDCLQ